MKKILLGSVATGALVAAGSASAADLGTRPVYKAAPVVAPIPVFSWTGCFVGAHGGWGWGKKDVTKASTFSSTHPRSNSGSMDTSGAIFGGQVGCDYQFASNFVIGVQGTLAGARLTGEMSDIQLFGGTTTTGSIRVRTDWLATVTGRVGVTGWLPRTLLYVRGGGAWLRERWSFSDVEIASNAGNEEFNGTISQTRSGWTIGGGLEYAIAPNWSIFAEFNYYDFGTKNLVRSSASSTAFTTTTSIDVRQRIEAVTVGVNYRFNFGKATPVMARY
jgi:outer membrane immunogenic protein